MLGQEAVDKVDLGPPQLLANAVDVKLGLEGKKSRMHYLMHIVQAGILGQLKDEGKV